ncbi:acyl-CoA thioesterase [Caulobacter sp. BP25]|uniref:acyl-CoA thioesterase n=1 Tax=Caulobacter sp. BP25 TaxID=2048900 RepID=UPI000C12DA41|nr:acyl-CoA thioesterase [Caulobacter sp. BP25]PHY19709.1 acyl-CoA thioesterase [Caulobacter sp. BP25]
MSGAASRLVDIVFPTDTNHHGTLFGGTGLSHLDKVAFVAATRHARMAFVTASCERIDFGAPAKLGEIVEAEGRVVRVGRRSIGVEAVLSAENLLTGERRECTRGVFNMVAVPANDAPLREMPPLESPFEPEDGALRMIEMVFPDRTNHYGTLFGGEALAMMGKAAFVASTRALRAPVMMAASQAVNFQAPIDGGDIVELTARAFDIEPGVGATVSVELWAENAISGLRRRSADGEFRMRVL